MSLSDVFSPALVSFDAIAWENHDYHLRFGREESPRLAESLKRTGLRNPPLVAASEEKFLIVFGFERLRIWRALGRTEAPVRVAASTSRPVDLLCIAVEDNMDGRRLNLIEQALALKKIHAFSEKEKDARANQETENLLALLGYKPSRSVAERLLGYLDLSEKAQIALAQGILPESAIPFLRSFSPSDQESLCATIQKYHLTTGMCRDFARQCLEICRRDGISAPDLLGEIEAESQGKEPLSHPVRRERLLEMLKRRRYPILSGLEREYRAAHAALALGDEIKIRPPRDFEGDGYRIEIRADSFEELEKTLNRLAERTANRRDLLDKIFNIRWEPASGEGRQADST